MTAFAATGDFDGDGRIDFLARRSDGWLYVYNGNGRGGFGGPPKAISKGWNQFTAITGPGDWPPGRGTPDLLVRKTDGSLLLYPGRFFGFESPRRISGGWSPYRLGV
jgi:hypothetical protein